MGAYAYCGPLGPEHPAVLDTKFTLVVPDHQNQSNSVVKEVSHTFKVPRILGQSGQDWGFRKLVRLSELHSQAGGFIKDESFSITVRLETYTTTRINVVTLDSLASRLPIFDLVNSSTLPVQSMLSLRPSSDASPRWLAREIWEVSGHRTRVPTGGAREQQLWIFCMRANGSFRPCERFVTEDEEKLPEWIWFQEDVVLFLGPQDYLPAPDEMLLFFKYYDPSSTRSTQVISRTRVHPHVTLMSTLTAGYASLAAVSRWYTHCNCP
jgi:hypothetical protein